MSRFQRWIDRFDEKKKFLEARVKDPYHGMKHSDRLKYMKEDYRLKGEQSLEDSNPSALRRFFQRRGFSYESKGLSS